MTATAVAEMRVRIHVPDSMTGRKGGLRIRREINESEGGQQRKNRITILLWENDG